MAQREGSTHVGPFLFNGTRFLLGSLWLLPFIGRFKKPTARQGIEGNLGKLLIPGLSLGIVLFVAASLQQVGIGYTTAGKAGFITGMYVIFVPLFGIFLKKEIRLLTAISAIIAFMGLYFLSIHGSFTLELGDSLVFVSAVFWAVHVLLIDHLVDRGDALKLAFLQFFLCGLISLSVALLLEDLHLESMLAAWLPILYAGLCSVGIGYTLQLVAQREAHPAHASIIMSLEGLFAAIGGWLFLNELLSGRELVGCLLMLGGMMLSQLQFRKPPMTKSRPI